MTFWKISGVRTVSYTDEMVSGWQWCYVFRRLVIVLLEELTRGVCNRGFLFHPWVCNNESKINISF